MYARKKKRYNSVFKYMLKWWEFKNHQSKQMIEIMVKDYDGHDLYYTIKHTQNAVKNYGKSCITCTHAQIPIEIL